MEGSSSTAAAGFMGMSEDSVARIFSQLQPQVLRSCADANARAPVSPASPTHRWTIAGAGTSIAGAGAAPDPSLCAGAGTRWSPGGVACSSKSGSRPPEKSQGSKHADVLPSPTTAEALSSNNSNDGISRNAAPAGGGVSGSTANFGLAACVLCTSMLIASGSPLPNWLLIVLCLVSTAVGLLGTSALKQIGECLSSQRCSRPFVVPLTDTPLDMSTMNKFASSCQVREKGLKICQYVLRGSAYSELLPTALSKQLKELSKTTSIARRFFKFFRWIKHFEDLAAAKEETSAFMRALLYTRIAANFGADWAEDVCSLERIGFLPQGTLSLEFMLFAEFCQLALALVEIGVTSVKVRKEQAKATTIACATASRVEAVLKQQRELALTQLELVKFVSDVGKAIFDCELPFAHEGVFIGCSLFSAVVSTHKNMIKALK